MVERRGNRFYPHANLSASGTFDPQIEPLLQGVESALSRGQLSAEDVKSALRCCELLFWKGSLDKVEELASRVIAEGCGFRATYRLYRFWIEALRSDYNFGSLRRLGRHLLGLRHSSRKFLPLSALALSYCGERRFAGKIISAVNQSSNRRWIAHIEAVAVYNSESPQRIRREKGLQWLQALNVRNTQNYFLARNYLVYALENDYLEEASRAFELIHERFPRCPEPFWGAARLAVAQGHWSEAVRVLQELVADNPSNTDALIALANCMEKTGDLLAARDILISSKNLFEKNDYDYCATLGALCKRLFERYHMDEYREEAVQWTGKAITAAERLSLPEASLRLAMSELSNENLQFGHRRFNSADGRRSSKEAFASPRAWILSVDDHDVSNFRKHSNLLMRSPETVNKGDLVLVARRFGGHDWRTSQQQVVGVMCTLSEVTHDARYGYAVCVGRYQELETPVDLQLGKETTALQDYFGCENFSAQSPVFFLDADPETNEGVVRAVERSLRMALQPEALEYAV